MRINEAVGSFLRRYRDEHGLTLDDVATASRKYGSGWTAAKIRDIEKGSGKADSLTTIILLLASINDLRRQRDLAGLTISDIFKDLQEVSVAESSSLTATQLMKVLSGSEVQLSEKLDSRDQYILNLATSDEYQHDRDLLEFFATHTPTATEERAAKKIGVSARLYAYLCFASYGHTLDEEIERVVGENASPQKRGSATRSIIEETSEWLESAYVISSPRWDVNALDKLAKQVRAAQKRKSE
ncbi:helix-turn-helix domain-containing protein [Bifidobacterium aerophilum]|uniref:Helix-turn-helix domain-containing protein n=1 Tax=Bifidobacterium aerophilum TaxID=1798155 RepID=A0A6N9Z1W6_9BIFI|nr:helix-turn-helix transcriptional regulator [Bifidobacterium aerophilum]NEG88599.1 helix-turn-helix domain-containing protein [Bifidobacterium aerophilum]